MGDANFDVLGIGNAIVDVIARCDDAFLAQHAMSKGHMQLILAAEAEALYGAMGPGVEVSGGSAANTCAGIASFGGNAAFIGRVAQDQLGRIFSHDIRSIGVDFDTEPAVDGAPTARSLILVTPDGERTMNTFLGASIELGEAELDRARIEGARLTYLEGYLFDPPLAQAAFHEAARIAAAAGRQVALSLSDAFCVARHRAAFRSLIQGGVDLLFANEEEICMLYEVDDFEQAAQAVRGECRLAALTRSAKGSLIVTPEERIEIQAAPVEKVVDVTGAGDLYAAGFLYGHAVGCDLNTCGKLASLAAAEAIGHLGARPEASLAELARSDGLIS
jgi:sugar/nucleoside kinase (ribokinase family)